jgi:mono/diheme cytochrome c family protein
MTQWSAIGVGVVAVGCVLGAALSAVTAQGQGDPKAGKAVYESAKCATCHGATGKGDGPQGQKLKDKPSDWTAGGGGLKGMNDQQIFDSVAKGGPAVGKSRAMPASPRLSEADIWNVVAYLKTFAK